MELEETFGIAARIAWNECCLHAAVPAPAATPGGSGLAWIELGTCRVFAGLAG